MTATSECPGVPTMEPTELERWVAQMTGLDCCAQHKPDALKLGGFYACPECGKTWICTPDPDGRLGYEEV